MSSLAGTVHSAAREGLRALRPLAEEVAKELDGCGSESEFRLRCAARNLDPDEFFRPYGLYAAAACGYWTLGLGTGFGLADWWRFEKVPGANKPDPWLRNTCDRLDG